MLYYDLLRALHVGREPAIFYSPYGAVSRPSAPLPARPSAALRLPPWGPRPAAWHVPADSWSPACIAMLGLRSQ